eukprot:TRINITY_DN11635_c0_g1_i2.p1 TRINITY_DN11635_c0_g1~~TRINITY_DN11635_c0_g1_i2.p1  ORF type:complete len:131 (+),score=17.67 TRINITY_DN11635_c0_g1_i2:1-393(+)
MLSRLVGSEMCIRDRSRAICKLLLDPKSASNKRIWEITGGAEISCRQIVELISETIGEEVKYQEISLDEKFWIDFLGVSETVANYLKLVFQSYTKGCDSQVLDDFKKLIPDQEQLTFKNWISVNAHVFCK